MATTTVPADPMALRRRASIAAALATYASPEASPASRCVAGIHLIAYVQKGHLVPSAEGDAEAVDILREIAASPSETRILYPFLRKAQAGDYALADHPVELASAA